ncbi:spore coat polysaccharide biosynthesis protein SpsA [Lachnospiraceae bacterium]|nr:spore coat polysaccharide biosynthesis protein SpsA [Lachnospiraceae bacterium]
MCKVTVILTTYNRREFLEEALSSILNQTFSDFQLIIWDNGSTINISDIIAKYDDKRIRYIKEEQNNVYKTEFISRIFNACETEYFLWTFDDDFWEKELLEKEMEAIERDMEIAAVSCNAKIVDRYGKELDYLFPVQDEDILFDQYAFIRNYMSRKINVKFTTGAMLIRNSYLKKLDCSFFDLFESLQGDTYWHMKLNELGKMAVLKGALYNHRVYTKGEMTVQATANYTAIFTAVLVSVPLLRKYCPKEECNAFELKMKNMRDTAQKNAALKSIMLKKIDGKLEDIEAEYRDELFCRGFQANDYNRIEILIRIQYLRTLFDGRKKYYIVTSQEDVESLGVKTREIFTALLPGFEFKEFIQDEALLQNKIALSKEDYYVIASKNRCNDCAEKMNEEGFKVLEDYIWGLGIY